MRNVNLALPAPMALQQRADKMRAMAQALMQQDPIMAMQRPQGRAPNGSQRFVPRVNFAATGEPVSVSDEFGQERRIDPYLPPNLQPLADAAIKKYRQQQANPYALSSQSGQ